jgi:cytochrome c-type biogenesis protein CcmH
MTTFWLIVGALLLLAVIWFVPALRRGHRAQLASQQARNIEIARERLKELEAERERGELDEASFEQARKELQLTLASELEEEKGEAKRSGSLPVLLSILVLVPVISLLSYRQIGSPEHIAVVGPGASAPAIDPHSPDSPADLDTLVKALADRLEAEPENPDGWYMLGRTYLAMGRYPEAVTALEKLRELIGDHPTALVMLADAVAMTQGGRISGRPADLIMKVLEQQPEDPTALWLAGKAAEEQGDYAAAVDFWRQAEPGLADQPDMLTELRGMIRTASARAGIEAPAPIAPPEPPPAAAGIDVSVTLDPGLAGDADPNDRVFVFARAVNGPPMPLAAARLQVKDLPAQVRLDDSMAMMPAMTLSSVPEVQIVARVSRGGEPTAQSGDLESEPRVVAVADGAALSLVIDRKIP